MIGNIAYIIFILFVHWLADFVGQTDSMAQNKSKSNKWLTIHAGIYTIVSLLGLTPLFVLNMLSWASFSHFIVIVFITHWITDYFTSRLNSKLWTDKKVHQFFTSIGFDQFLHFTQLLLTYKLLFE